LVRAIRQLFEKAEKAHSYDGGCISRSLQNRTVPDNAAPTLFANTMIQSALKIP
jgi:hypothetical protein